MHRRKLKSIRPLIIKENPRTADNIFRKMIGCQYPYRDEIPIIIKKKIVISIYYSIIQQYMHIPYVIYGCHDRELAIISAMLLSLLLILITVPHIAAAATPYNAGYSHGCDDGKLGFHKYLAITGLDNVTPEFMQGYDNGYKACFSPNGTPNAQSGSDTGGTLVSCNRAKHSTEYCNRYRAGAVQSDVHDDPDENITPSKVSCNGPTEGGSPGSEYCAGYQQGYADEDHAMTSPQ